LSVKTTTLENGLRIVSDSMDTVESVSLGVWVEVGGRHEPVEITGVSHLLEHMAFKGTKKRTALAIAEEIEAVGGHLNAYTSRENTAYYAKVLKGDMPLALDIISDIVRNPTLPQDELKREREVIVQEINQANDTPDDVVFDRFQETAFPKQPLGRPILGLAEQVRRMPRKDIIAYMKAYYTGPSMVLAAAGNLDHEKLVELARDAFSGLSEKTGKPDDHARYKGGESRNMRDLEQVQVVLGFEGVDYKNPDFYDLSIWSTVLGGGMSSRLFQEIREKRGLVYSIYSFLSCYHDSGLFGVGAGCGEKESGTLVPLVCDELLKACEDVSEKEVMRARAQIKAGILMALESTSSRCEQLARQMIVFKRPLKAAEIVEKLDAVTPNSVMEAARKIVSRPLTLATLGPVSKVTDFSSITKRLGG
jgi:predicted Zn-dependent peptidase